MVTQVINNLTLPKVQGEIESVLAMYSDSRYRRIFAIPMLREELIAYVLSRVANDYTVSTTNECFYRWNERCTRREQIEYDYIIHQGIQRIIEDEYETIQHQLPSVEDPANSPSHWFG